MSTNLLKLRNTARFVLGNLNGFTAEMLIDYDQLPALDRFALGDLALFTRDVELAYDGSEFQKGMLNGDVHVTTHCRLASQTVYHALLNYASGDLSQFYLDLTKDRLYNSQQDGHDRRSAQTTLYHILRHFTAALAPVAPHLAEEVFEHARASMRQSDARSIFELGWPQCDARWLNDELVLRDAWNLKQARVAVNGQLEAVRANKYGHGCVQCNLSCSLLMHPWKQTHRQVYRGERGSGDHGRTSV